MTTIMSAQGRLVGTAVRATDFAWLSAGANGIRTGGPAAMDSATEWGRWRGVSIGEERLAGRPATVCGFSSFCSVSLSIHATAIWSSGLRRAEP